MITKLPKIIWKDNVPYELILTYIKHGNSNSPDFRWTVSYNKFIGSKFPRVVVDELELNNSTNPSLSKLEKDILPQLEKYEKE